MNLRQISYFVGVVDAGSFSRAATLLRVAQPALSHQVSNLERELDVPLLVRGSRGIEPTEAGAAFYRSARIVLNELERARQQARAEGRGAASVSLGIPPSLPSPTAAAIVAAVLHRHPGITLRLLEGESESHQTALLRGDLDLAVLHGIGPAPGLMHWPLPRVPLVFVTGRGEEPTAPTITVEALRDRTLALPPPGTAVRSVVDQVFLACGAAPKVWAEASGRAVLLALAEAPGGGTILPDGGDIAPWLSIVTVVGPPLSMEASLSARREARSSERVDAVRQGVVQVLDEAATAYSRCDAFTLSQNTMGRL